MSTILTRYCDQWTVPNPYFCECNPKFFSIVFSYEEQQEISACTKCVSICIGVALGIATLAISCLFGIALSYPIYTPDCALISSDSFFRRFRYELTLRSAAL